MKKLLFILCSLPSAFNPGLTAEPLNTQEANNQPWIIAHRGASGYRPEHTILAYKLAIEQGADFIEPDLVSTRDGKLIARHENELSGTTNISDLAQFQDRHTTKLIDGEEITGWFSEDFTLEEIKQLEARERIPVIRPDNRSYENGLKILTLQEILQLVERTEATSHRRIKIIPEIKHPTYFLEELGISLGQLLIDELETAGFTDSERVYIQCFEVAPLLELKNRIMPAAKVDYSLVQLLGDTRGNVGGFSQPYDMVFNSGKRKDLDLIYGELNNLIDGGIDETTTYYDLINEQVIAYMARSYASVLSPWKTSLYQIESDENSNHLRVSGHNDLILTRAKKHRLLVVPYTLRADDEFLLYNASNEVISGVNETRALFERGVDGVFIDQPDVGIAAREMYLTERKGVN
jgi:glycerophosphoryl diester phosphodiesterase